MSTPEHIQQYVEFSDIWIHEAIDNGTVTNRDELVELIRERVEEETRGFRSALYDAYKDADRFLERLGLLDK